MPLGCDQLVLSDWPAAGGRLRLARATFMLREPTGRALFTVGRCAEVDGDGDGVPPTRLRVWRGRRAGAGCVWVGVL